MNTELTLILNTHMPYVLGQGDIFREPENWLFEAITETYIPLFLVLSRWREDDFAGKKIVLSMTPCLFRQLLSCRERYLAYLDVMHKITAFEVERTANLTLYNRYQRYPQALNDEQLGLLHTSAQAYFRRINDARDFMANHDLIPFLKKLLNNQLSHVEVWTSTPNHNFLPFFSPQNQSQFVRRGVELFRQVFEREPDGMWLPECAYKPGVEKALLENGVTQTSVALPAVEPYHEQLKSGVYHYGDLKLLVQDFRIGQKVWQAAVDTLPSNPVYREFYRDIGFDLTREYFSDVGVDLPHVDGKPKQVWTGVKYFAKATADVDLGYKPLYDWAQAEQQARTDARRFVEFLDTKREHVYDHKHFIAAFDTELFGHWWHEGITWLEQLLKEDFTRSGDQA